MTNPTSNFGWQMPTSTDLVTDLPADFETFGQAVDTSLADLKGGTTGQVLKKNSNTDMDFVWSADAAGMSNPMTTTGDTIYSSSGSTPARLGIGTTGQVLTVSGGVPSWASPAGSKSFSLLNAGGTALTGAATITVSGISGMDQIMILVDSASSSASSNIIFRFNGDTGANYSYFDHNTYAPSSYSASTVFGRTTVTGGTQMLLCALSSNAASVACGYVRLSGCNTSGVKMVDYSMGANAGGGTGHTSQSGGGVYVGTSTISSVSIIADGNFDNGTIYVYGAA